MEIKEITQKIEHYIVACKKCDKLSKEICISGTHT